MNWSLDIQVVSHGHHDCLPVLLDDIEPGQFRIFVAENLAASELRLPAREDLTFMRNDRELGFGENHNRLAAFGNAEFIAILNPDLRIPPGIWDELVPYFDEPDVAIVAPRVYSPRGSVEDNARFVVTPMRFVRRVMNYGHVTLDYPEIKRRCEPDWVAGLFMLVRRRVFEELGGFDPGYRLYCEDVDLCVRAWLKGYKVLCVPSEGVVHAARRASRYNATHFRWHVASMFRLWRSASWKRFVRIRT